MIPLNLRDVIWISGTAAEIQAFYKSHPDIEKLGWNDDVRPMLVKAANYNNLDNMEPFLKMKGVRGAFALLQGKIIGLVVLPDTKT